MAKRISAANWRKIEAALAADPALFGLPEGGREASLVFASFNLRKLGKRKNREAELDFLARFCARCDLVAIQEVQDDLEGLRFLKERMESAVAGDGEFGILVSDITGEVPGEPGMAERLAFIYRWRRITRLDLASDLTIDRTSVLANFFGNEAGLVAERRSFETQMARFTAGKRKTAPTYTPPAFVTFVRTPHVAAFEARAANDQPPLHFAAVNAHLVFGTVSERRQEFEALLRWIIFRLKAERRLVAPNFILLGDLNLKFDKPGSDRGVIEERIRHFNTEAFGDPDRRRVYFPFIDPHPRTGKVIRTAARSEQTFDQIAFFRASAEERLPDDRWRAVVDPGNPDGFDYGVFNFADLFARAIKGKPYQALTKAERSELGNQFQHSVSDHLPIWVRIPRPGFAPPPRV